VCFVKVTVVSMIVVSMIAVHSKRVFTTTTKQGRCFILKIGHTFMKCFIKIMLSL